MPVYRRTLSTYIELINYLYAYIPPVQRNPETIFPQTKSHVQNKSDIISLGQYPLRQFPTQTTSLCIIILLDNIPQWRSFQQKSSWSGKFFSCASLILPQVFHYNLCWFQVALCHSLWKAHQQIMPIIIYIYFTQTFRLQ